MENKKIDIKEIFQGENRKTISAIILFSIVIIIMLVFYFSSDTVETTDELSSPERETENYNSKLEAQQTKKDESIANDLSVFEKNTEEEPKGEKFDTSAIDEAIANVGKEKNDPEHKPINKTLSKEEKPINTTIRITKNKISENTEDYNYDNGNHYNIKNQKNVSKKITTWTRKNIKNKTTDNVKVYKASIVSSRGKYITPENNRVQIRVIEPFSIKELIIPRKTQLVAYAEFSSDLKLVIKSIMIDKKVLPVNISVLDSQGQEAIEIVGGTGADIGNEITDEAVSNTTTGESMIDRAISIVSSKRKPKAIISSDFVYLKINE